MRSAIFVNNVASIVPEMECHAQDMAHGTTERGFVAIKNVDAKLVARPAFCIPTSMLMVLFFAFENLKRRPTI